MASELKSFDDLYPGRFIKAGQFHGKQVTLTIADVRHEQLEGERGKELKVILAFQKTDKQLVLCKLNGTCIKGMFTSSVANWIGKRITFFPTDTMMPMPTAKGDDRVCIRVWGSPDLASDVGVEWKPARRKATVYTMHAVKAAPQTAATPQAAPSPAQSPADAPSPGCGVCNATGKELRKSVCFDCASDPAKEDACKAAAAKWEANQL